VAGLLLHNLIEQAEWRLCPSSAVSVVKGSNVGKGFRKKGIKEAAVWY